MPIDILDRTPRIPVSFLLEDDGVTAMEYGLLAALIAVVCIAAFKLTGTSLVDVYVMWTSAVRSAL